MDQGWGKILLTFFLAEIAINSPTRKAHHGREIRCNRCHGEGSSYIQRVRFFIFLQSRHHINLFEDVPMQE